MLPPKLTRTEYSFDYYRQYEEVLHKAGFYYLGVGAYRTAFRRKNVVVKIPQSYLGFLDNIYEAYAYRKYRREPGPNDEIYIPCRLLSNVCIMMPFVKRIQTANELPEWTRYIDGQQVGMFNGRVVVYDSACDIETKDQYEARKWAGILA